MLAVSTSWEYKPDLDVLGWLNRVKSLGIDAIELGYSLNHKQLVEFIHFIPQEGFRVLSIHNFCPKPFDGPVTRHVSNFYRLSSPDEAERQKAVYWTEKTIDTALAVKAGVIVIHAGTIVASEDPSKQLIALYKDGKKDTKEFEEARQKTLKLREEAKGPFLDALRKSLTEVLSYASQHNVKIGLETRFYPFEIPNFEEVGLFLNEFRGKGLFYWHDVGHAEVNERLNIRRHLDFLKAYKEDLIGVHLHGVRGLRDHLAVYDGDMDLEDKLEYFGNGIIKIIESRYGHYDQLKEGIERLKEKISA